MQSTSCPEQANNTLCDSDTKLFKLNSTGNWDDVGTGKATITRKPSPIESLDILLSMVDDSEEKIDEENEGQKGESSDESFLFEGVTNFSIQSGSILVFMSREKRFALSFKDSDADFLEFFKQQIKSSQEKIEQQDPQSKMASTCGDDTMIQSIKTSFYKYEEERDFISLFDTFKVFRRLLNQCKEDFIRIMFTDENVQFIFSVLEYSYHNSTRIPYRHLIKNISYVNTLELPPNIQKHAKFNMYLAEFKEIASLVIEPGLQSLMTLFNYENGTAIINYILLNPSVIKRILLTMQDDIVSSVKLFNELMTLTNNVSVDTKTRLFSYLINEKGGNIYTRLADCLNHRTVREQINSDQQETTLFQNIIEIFFNLSGINTYVFENYIAQISQQTNRKQTSNGREFCESLVFGYLNGNLNLKSRILELISNIFNPDTPKTRWDNQIRRKNNLASHSIYRLLERNVLSPICKQLFQKKNSYSGQQLMMEWLARLFPSFNMILRRVIVDSGLMRKALLHSQKKSIILLLVLKILKGMLQIKNSAYTVRYLKNSGIINSLRKAYIKNNGKSNLIGSLFRGILEQIRQSNEVKTQKELQRIFELEETNYQ